MIIDATLYIDLTLLLLRLITGLIFFDSGLKDVKDPQSRSGSMGMSVAFTVFLGIAEIAGGIGIALGILTQFAAIGLTLIMLGAIYKKTFVWKTGFWGSGQPGWHYDLLLLIIGFVIVTTGGGKWLLIN